MDSTDLSTCMFTKGDIIFLGVKDVTKIFKGFLNFHWLTIYCQGVYTSDFPPLILRRLHLSMDSNSGRCLFSSTSS